MYREQINIKLVGLIKKALKKLDAPFTTKRQYNPTVDALMFKRNGNRVYCYVLDKDKTPQRTRVNLVFRFRSGDNPKEWFSEKDVRALVSDWQAGFTKIWCAESGTPLRYREPAVVTEQFGLKVSENDLKHASIEETISCFVEIAVEAAIAASRQKDRDWSRYEALIA